MGRLSAQEFAEKVRLAQAGDADALRDAAHDQLPLVKFAAGKYSQNWKGVLLNSEAQSEVFLALVRAIKTFDLNSDIKFSSWACTCIFYSLLTLVRNECRRPDRTIGYDREPTDDIDPPDDIDPVPFLAESSANLKRLEILLSAWKADARRRRYAAIIELSFGIDPRGPLGYHEIGPILGLGRERTRELADRAFGWICDEFGVQRRTSLHKARSNNC